MKNSTKTSIASGSLVCCLGLFSSGILVAQEDPNAQPIPRAVPLEELLPDFSGDETVISHTEQFKVSGGDSATRGTAANLAEEAKDEFLRLTEQKDEWKIPVRISLMGKPGDAIPKRETVLKLYHTGEHYEIAIFVNLSRGLRPVPLKNMVTEALVYTRGLQETPFEKDLRFSVPPWFVEGLQESTAWRLKQTDRRLYDALFRHGGLFKLNDLFAVSDAEFGSIDAVSRAAFRVSSGALVMALLEQPDGKTGIGAFMQELPSYQGEMPSLLRKHFPELNLSETSLAKWWALQLANKGTAPLTESFTVAETERLLEEALRVRLRDAEGNFQELSFSEWKNTGNMEGAARIEAVRLAQDDLLRLSYRCFPSYRSLLLEYQTLLGDFAKGETGSLDSSLAALSETRQIMVEKATRARDFLDWFEITRARQTSGAFDDYLALKARLKITPNNRKDDLSKYLDRLDPLFTMPEKKEDPFGLIDTFPSY